MARSHLVLEPSGTGTLDELATFFTKTNPEFPLNYQQLLLLGILDAPERIPAGAPRACQISPDSGCVVIPTSVWRP